MHYSRLTGRIQGRGSAAWDLHFEATQRHAAGEPVIVLSVGDPDFDTPAPVVEAALQSLRGGATHYASIQGVPRLREAIATRFSRASGVGAQQFAEQLLRQHAVSVLPGDPFGAQAAGHLRLGLVEPVPVLQEACRRICALAVQLLGQRNA